MRVDLKLGQLLHEAFGFIDGEELSNADADKGGGVGVTELAIHLSEVMVMEWNDVMRIIV